MTEQSKDTTIRFSNMPAGLDDELIQKRDTLIFEGKKEFRSLLENCDMKNPEEERKIKSIIAAKKGAYSRKFFQHAKEIFLADLFARNNIPVTFKNYNFVAIKIFGESLDKSILAKIEKDTKYGKGVQSPIHIENEVEMVQKLQFAIKLMIKPYRDQVLEHLAYTAIYTDYNPENNITQSKLLKI